jgi:hypothetical protein
MNKTTEALKLAEALENDAKEHREVSYGLDCPPERTANWKHALNCEAAARLIREALAEPVKQERDARILSVADDLLEIVEAVGHIGVDFGFGEFHLEQSHIEKARSTFIKITEGEV